MREDIYYLVKEKAIPEVLIKVVEAKKLLSEDRNMSIIQATDKVGIVEVPFINTRMIYQVLVIMPEERL